MTKRAMCAAALGALMAAASVGWADTLVMPVAAESATKSRYVKRAVGSVRAAVDGAEDVSLSDQDAADLTGVEPFECAGAVTCLVAAGHAVGAGRVVGIAMTAEGKDHRFAFLLVDVRTGKEIARHAEVVRHRALKSDPGPRLVAFLTSQPEAPAPTAPDPVASEVESDAEAAVAQDVEAAPVEDPAPAVEAEPVVAPVAATTVRRTARTSAQPALHVGLQAGVFLPQVSSELATTGAVKLEVGYRVWRHLATFGAASYAQPSISSDLSDPRVGDYATDTTQKELAMTLGVLWRLRPVGAALNAYGGAGARVWLLETVTNGDAAGAAFLENTETSTRVGAAAMFGGELRLGPGAGVVELEVAGSDLPHLTTGDVATTAVTLGLGYRLLH